MEGLHYGIGLGNGDVRYRKGADVIVEERGNVESYVLAESVSIEPGQRILVLRKIRTSAMETPKEMTFIVLRAAVGQPLILRFAGACHMNGLRLSKHSIN